MDHQRICHWCGRSFNAPVRAGPRPRYCCRSHRQRAYEARRKAASGGGGQPRPGLRATSTSPIKGGSRQGNPRPDRHDVTISLLGSVRAFRDGERIEFSPELRSVAAALALRPRQVVSVEKLTDSIWPGVDEDAARGRLRTAIWKLRRLLEAGGEDGRNIVRWVSPGYVLDVADEQLDWTRFDRLRRAGERALDRGAPALAKTCLAAALSMWEGSEPLIGADVPPEDAGSAVELRIQRARTIMRLAEASFELGDFRQIVPELERYVAADPLDADLVGHLATAYYFSDEPSQALAVCRRHLELTEKERVPESAGIRDLYTAILRHSVERPSHKGRKPHPTATYAAGSHNAFVAAAWAPYDPPPSGPLPAELLLLIEGHGGVITGGDETSLEAEFPEAHPALQAAVEIQRKLGEPPLARVGVEIHTDNDTDSFLEGPPRARSRLLALAAREGQILVSGIEETSRARQFLPTEVRLQDLGKHRLNSLTPPSPIFEVTGPGLSKVEASPRWFDQDTVNNLAIEPFRLVGRESEVDGISRHLLEARLVTLTGAPGAGKTRLAAHVAASMARDYADGAWFVNLQPVSEPGLVAATVADALRIPKPAAVHLHTLVRSLHEKHALIVVDNCEHLLAECRELAEGLLPACPNITMLATSREALYSSLERTFPVHPLETPPAASAEEVLENPAVQLFYDRLPSSSDRPTDREELEAVARICRAVEGIPLALVLAAARAHEMGASTLADLLEDPSADGLRILSSETRHDTHSTLRGTIEWSYRLLSETDRLLFDCLSVFQTHFGMADVVAVVTGRRLLTREEAISGLQKLVGASLVESVPSQDSFRLLQPVREFASSRLARRSRKREKVPKRHAEHFLAMAEDAEPNVRGRTDLATLDRLDRALPDLYAAIRWAVDRGEAMIALRLVGALWVFWLVRGRILEGHELVEAALTTDTTPTPERTKALVACSQLAWFSGNLARAHETCREVLAAAEATGDEWAWAWGPLGIAAADMFKDQPDGLPFRIEELLPTFRALGNDWDTGQAIQTLGGAAWHRGLYEFAEWALSESLALYVALGHPSLMASRLAHGLMLALLGDLAGGAAEVDASIIASYESGDLGDLAYALCHRGAIARYGGHHARARHYFRNALVTGRDAGSLWAIQWALNGLASIDGLGAGTSTARIETCVELLASADVLSRETGIILPPRERAMHARDLAMARARLGERRYSQAIAQGERLRLDQAIELALELESPADPVPAQANGR